MASYNGHTDIVKLLLKDNRVNPSADKNHGKIESNLSDNTTAIQEATRNKHIDVVKLLLQDNRVDPSDDNNKGKLNQTCLTTQQQYNWLLNMVTQILSSCFFKTIELIHLLMTTLVKLNQT